MSTVVASLQGRLGNQCLTYLFCRALALRTGSELRVDPWPGERVFAINDPRPNYGRTVCRKNATEAIQWSLLPSDKRDDIEVRDYCQMQQCMIYSKREAQAWLQLRPEIEETCYSLVPSRDGHGDEPIICHRRVGDYVGYGYPVVSLRSYEIACITYGLDWQRAAVLSEENPTPNHGLPDDLSFMPDFYRMKRAATLLRANSTFSWLAALLGNGIVLSPVIDGLEGGKEHHCRFVPGNHPRFTNLDFVQDLYVAP